AVYGCAIIVGARTAQAVASEFALLEVDSIRVKGKKEPEVIYTVLGRSELVDTAKLNVLQERWADVLLTYRKRDWTGALQALDRGRDACEQFDLAGLITAYASRIQRLEQNPPGPDWDGVFTAETK